MKQFPLGETSYVMRGSDPVAMNAKIVMEFSECGPGCFARKKELVCLFLLDLHKQDLATAEEYSLRFEVSEALAPYASVTEGVPCGGINRLVILSTDKDPVYHSGMRESDWVKLVELYVRKLSEEFHLPNLKIKYHTRGIKIYQGRIHLNEAA